MGKCCMLLSDQDLRKEGSSLFTTTDNGEVEEAAMGYNHHERDDITPTTQGKEMFGPKTKSTSSVQPKNLPIQAITSKGERLTSLQAGSIKTNVISGGGRTEPQLESRFCAKIPF